MSTIRFSLVIPLIILIIGIQYSINQQSKSTLFDNIIIKSYSFENTEEDNMVIARSFKETSDRIHQFVNDEDLQGTEPESILKLRQSTKEKIHRSMEIISQALDEFEYSNISISFNGGKDCLVMLHLYMAVLNDRKLVSETHDDGSLKKMSSVYIYYEDTFEEIEEFNKETSKTYNLDLQVYSYCKLKVGFEKYLDDHRNIQAIIVGNRKTDPYSENLQAFQPTDNDWPSFVRVHPILDWTYQEIWFFLINLNVHYCKLYDYGYTSIGGISSTIPNQYLKKTDFELKNKDINRENLNWMIQLYQKNSQISPEYRFYTDEELEAHEHYPAFYLQNDDYERFSRQTKQKAQ
ncbi:FMN adenylyltransferase [Saccharomycopsis crataegensis]|uniref:FAD synthase n=1 Tax=Saccharomycopsis crataegensis TaxID=43959 RepID=A0AAV5QW84_9ASCO|nr:FMN adenylyltransferase [Saccharomycopsis crataegensis]